MTDVAISALPNGTTPLTGTEAVPVVQGGSTVQVPANAFGVQGPSVAVAGNLPAFSGTSGKLVSDSGVAAAKVVTASTTGSVAGRLVSYSSTTGKAIVPLALGSIPGVTNGSTAGAGIVGQMLTASSTNVPVTTGTTNSILKMTLTPGQWLVWGLLETIADATTVITGASGWISTGVSDPGFPNGGAYVSHNVTNKTGPSFQIYPLGNKTINVSVNTTIHVAGVLTFTTSTAKIAAALFALRPR